MENKILITKVNEEQYITEKKLIENYVETRNQIANLQEALVNMEIAMEKLDFKTIGIQDSNIRFTITPSKTVKKINYDKTFQENTSFDASKYKKEIISFKWIDDLIEEEIKDKVIYDDINYKARVLVKELKKGEENE